jgi:hypothetical protein
MNPSSASEGEWRVMRPLATQTLASLKALLPAWAVVRLGSPSQPRHVMHALTNHF